MCICCDIVTNIVATVDCYGVIQVSVHQVANCRVS